jgi:hypothetical protein
MSATTLEIQLMAPRRPPFYHRYRLYFFSPDGTPVPHRPDRFYDVVDALDSVDARRMGKRRHPDLLVQAVPYPRKPQ